MEGFPFETPKDQFRGLDLWMVNDELDDEEIVRQVKEFCEKGLYSVIFRTYNGLISDYPGPKFKHKVRVAVDAARTYGLKLALQAGFMPSAYPALPKEYALHRIVPIPQSEVTESHCVLTRYGDIAFTDQIAAATVNMLDPASVEYYIRTAYEEMWSEFSDEFGKTVIAIWLDEPRFDNRYLTWSGDMEQHFWSKYGYSIQENIPSLYYDIGDYKKIRYDYFTLLRDTMEENYYAAVREWSHKNHLLFAGHLMGEEYLSTQISQSIASMPFYQYFDIPGVDMLNACHDWYDKPLLPVEKKRRQYTERSMHVSAIQCTSAAEQAGKELKLCEMYGVTSLGFSFRDLMHMFDFFAANGINHQCMHALFYSPRGFRKRFYPQIFNVYQPFWENFKSIKDYVAAVSHFNSLGSCAVDVAVLHPLETAYGLFRGLTDPCDPSNRAVIDRYDDLFYRLIVQLYSAQIGFHFADPSMINTMGEIKGNRFCVGKMSYGSLVLADLEALTSKTLSLITEFAKNGGSVFIKGDIPTRLDGRYAPELKGLLLSLPNISVLERNEDLIHSLREQAQKNWEYRCESDASDTVINHRIDGERHYFFIHNGSCRQAKKGQLILGGCHTAYAFYADTLKAEALEVCFENEKTIIPFQNPIGGSTMIFTAPCQASSDTPHEKNDACTRIPIQNVSCRALGENILTLELCRYKTEAMENFSEQEFAIEHLVEQLKQEHYEGNITLQFGFLSEFHPKGMKLILEDVQDCRITVNGIKITPKVTDCYFSKAFHVIELPDCIHPGVNTVEITRYTKPQVSRKPSDDMKHLFELFRAPVGVDLERIHLLGDFSVRTTSEPSDIAGILRFGKDFALMPRKALASVSDITSCGYPFYPDAIEYTAKIKATKAMLASEKILFQIGEFNGCTASVSINGKPIGIINREPYSIGFDPKDLLPDRDNEIKIRLLGTFRNMLGPSHVPDFDPCNCNKKTWYEHYDHAENTKHDIEKLASNFRLIPYGIGHFCLKMENQKSNLVRYEKRHDRP